MKATTRFMVIAGGAWVVLILILLALFYALQEREDPNPLLNQTLPHFTLPQLSQPGQTFSPLTMARRVFILNVFASWCAPCLQEHPIITDLSKHLPVVGLLYRDDIKNADNWLKRHGNPYSVIAVDSDGKAAVTLGIPGLPVSYLIDGQGHIRYRHNGPLTPEIISTKIIPLIEHLDQATSP